MKTAVLWARVRDIEEPALVVDCEKFANVIVMDFPIHVYTAAKNDAFRWRQVMHKGEPYPIERNIQKYFDAVKFHGITPGARRLMEAVLNGDTEIPDCKPSENNATEENKKKARAYVYDNPVEDDMDPPHTADIVQSTKKVRAAPTGRVLRGGAATVSDGDGSLRKRIPRPSGETRGNVVKQLSERLGVEPVEIRKALRKAGLKQPYGTLEECLAVIQPGHGKQ